MANFPSKKIIKLDNDNYLNEWDDGLKEWYFCHQRHRLDGPAIEFPINNNLKEWWYYDKKIDCHSQEEFEKWIKLKAFW
jgi:hypothetical protein